MKVKLSVSRAREQEVRAALAAHGIQVDEDADLVLSERDRSADCLMVRDRETRELVRLPAEEIVSVESFGHAVEVYARDGVYRSGERLYRLEALLGPERFLRVSNSAIVARDKIRRISPALSMKFTLTMADGRRVDVTRSYYYLFRERLGI